MEVACGTLTARDLLGKSEVLSGQKEPPPSATYSPHELAWDRTSDSLASSHCTACRLLLSTSPTHTLRQKPSVRIEWDAVWDIGTGLALWHK